MTKKMAFAVLVCALIGCGGDDDANLCVATDGVSGTRSLTIESSGLQRTLLMTVPESALTGRPVPLVLVYHGVFADGPAIQTLTSFDEKADDEGFITVAADGVERSWNAGLCCDPAMTMEIDDVLFARDIVAAVENEYCIDRRRVFATGFSNGAAMVFRLMCEASDLFTAFAPVAGSVALFPCEPSEPRPIEIINNVDDQVVPLTLGEDLSFPQALIWNDCGEELVNEMPAATANCRVAPQCAAGVRTAFCTIDGLNHVWPGGPTDPDGVFSATDHIWEFFAAVPF